MRNIFLVFVIFVMSCSLCFGEQRLWKSNPFSESGVVNSAITSASIPLEKSNLQLQGIWHFRKTYKAMISSEIVAIGSKFQDYLIREITGTRVVLKSISSGENIILELKK
ncbi:hypothetical protein ACFL2K_03030 [Candidatus Margulisiibacteriota bacterium]